jgi:hypothetical protein
MHLNNDKQSLTGNARLTTDSSSMNISANLTHEELFIAQCIQGYMEEPDDEDVSDHLNAKVSLIDYDSGDENDIKFRTEIKTNQIDFLDCQSEVESIVMRVVSSILKMSSNLKNT